MMRKVRTMRSSQFRGADTTQKRYARALKISNRKAANRKGAAVGTAFSGLTNFYSAGAGRSALGLTSGFGLAELGVTLGSSAAPRQVRLQPRGSGLSRR